MQYAEKPIFEIEHTDFKPMFVGRKKELDWLSQQSFASRFEQAVIAVVGPSGIGKTSLVRRFLAEPIRVRQLSPVFWSVSASPDEAMIEIIARIEELYSREHEDRPDWVVIDNAEILTDVQINFVAARLLNLKAIKRVLFLTRRLLPSVSRAYYVELGLLKSADVYEILRQRSNSEISQELLAAVVSASGGVPRNVAFLARIIGQYPNNALNLIKGQFYTFGQGLVVPKKHLISLVRPRLILANEALVERLQREPQSVFELPSRKFEELVAELLTGLGYQVELTPATKDGGKDILAYMSTPHGRLLCLVEAKRYRYDRVVGVELVRQLYGTLIDADASSAMLVTTSSFSSGAKAFQQKHQYKLALRDYSHIVEWIQNHRKD